MAVKRSATEMEGPDEGFLGWLVYDLDGSVRAFRIPLAALAEKGVTTKEFAHLVSFNNKMVERKEAADGSFKSRGFVDEVDRFMELFADHEYDDPDTMVRVNYMIASASWD